MAARKGDKHPSMRGNQYAKGSTTNGRPRKVDENNMAQVTESLVTFFQSRLEEFERALVKWKAAKMGKASPVVNVPFYADFARSVDISYRTLRECDTDENKDFSRAWQRCKDIQKQYINLAAMNGLSNATFSIFAASNLTDWRQKNQLTGEGDGPVKLDISDILTKVYGSKEGTGTLSSDG